MKVLIINGGSSSFKYQLIEMDTETVLAKGLAERIGLEQSKITHEYWEKGEKHKISKETHFPTTWEHSSQALGTGFPNGREHGSQVLGTSMFYFLFFISSTNLPT